MWTDGRRLVTQPQSALSWLTLQSYMTADVKKPSCNLWRTNCSLNTEKDHISQINYYQLIAQHHHQTGQLCLWQTCKYMYLIQQKMEINKGMKQIFLRRKKCYSLFLFAQSIYLILVRATALLSVFWNKARIRFFTSELENSNASGPLLSAHLWRGSTDKSANHTHWWKEKYNGKQKPFFQC